MYLIVGLIVCRMRRLADVVFVRGMKGMLLVNFSSLWLTIYKIGAKVGYVSMAGTSSNIEGGIVKHNLVGHKNPDGSDMFYFIQYDGNHISYNGYYCDKFGMVENQVSNCLIIIITLWLFSAH